MTGWSLCKGVNPVLASMVTQNGELSDARMDRVQGGLLPATRGCALPAVGEGA